jgi:alkanesulfonate monooxygenase SsuD/methylene tetrahydromethanopterin reductase-like flavin-dependent oxidoreductase (luciferase family)
MPHQIQFGLFQPQVGLSFSILKERALAAEEYGFHSIWLPDHMWVRGLPQLDIWRVGQSYPASPVPPQRSVSAVWCSVIPIATQPSSPKWLRPLTTLVMDDSNLASEPMDGRRV